MYYRLLTILCQLGGWEGVFFINYLLYSVLNICCLCVRSLRELGGRVGVFLSAVYFICESLWLYSAASVYYRNWVDTVGGWVFFYFILTWFCFVDVPCYPNQPSMLTEPLKTLTEPCLRHSNALRAWIMNCLVSYFCWWRDVGGRAGDFISILLCCICCECVRSLCELGGRVGVFFWFLICCICFICVLSVDQLGGGVGVFFFDCFAFNLLYLLCLCTIGCWLSCVNSVGGWVFFL